VLLSAHDRRQSGKERVNPMMYLEQDGRIFVFASKAGADTTPTGSTIWSPSPRFGWN